MIGDNWFGVYFCLEMLRLLSTLDWTASPARQARHARPANIDLGGEVPRKTRNAKQTRKPRYAFFVGSIGALTFDLSNGTRTNSDPRDR